MKKFTLNLLAFLLLPILFISIPVATLYFSGESLSRIDDDVAKNDKYLIGYAYHESNYKYLKWKYLETHPEKAIWALGSSRVLQFRAGMFSSSFYNAGFTIESVSDFKPFMEGIHHSKYPKMIIISLDQWMFNANWDAMEKPQKPKDYCKTSYQFMPSVGVLKMTLKDIFKRKYRLKDLLNDEETCKIGLQAKVNNKGFRNDGSMTEGSDIQKRLNNDQTLEDFGFRNTLKRIELGINRFERGDTLNTKSLKVLDEFLSFCHQHQIEVISFLPPFAQSVNEALETSGRHNYIANIEKAVRPIVENYGFELWNFQHLNLHGISDKDMIDGFHGGEQVHVKMLLHMLGNNSIIKKHTRENLLQNALNKQKSTFEVLPY